MSRLTYAEEQHARAVRDVVKPESAGISAGLSDSDLKVHLFTVCNETVADLFYFVDRHGYARQCCVQRFCQRVQLSRRVLR